MATKREILSKLESQLSFERRVDSLYSRILPHLGKATEASVIRNIIKDEREHAKIVQEMISMVKSYDRSVKTTQSKSDLPAKFEKGNSFAFISPLEKYMHTLLFWLESIEGDVLYISYGKISSYIKNLLKEKGIDMRRIEFMDCVDGSLSPRDLTQVSMEMRLRLAKKKSPLVIIDSVTNFRIFQRKENIERFVLNFSNEARNSKYKIVWVLFENPVADGFNESISQLCDAILRN